MLSFNIYSCWAEVGKNSYFFMKTGFTGFIGLAIFPFPPARNALACEAGGEEREKGNQPWG